MFGYPTLIPSKMSQGMTLSPGLNQMQSGYPSKHPNLIIDFHADYFVERQGDNVIAWRDRARGITMRADGTIAQQPTYTKNYNGMSGIKCVNSYLRYTGKIPELESITGLTVIFITCGVQSGSYQFTEKGGFSLQLQGQLGNKLVTVGMAMASGSASYTWNVRNGASSSLVATNNEMGGPINIHVLSFDGTLQNDDRIQVSINGGGRITGNPNASPTRLWSISSHEKTDLIIGGQSTTPGTSVVSTNGFQGTVYGIQFYNKCFAPASNELTRIINGIKRERGLSSTRQLIAVGDSRTANSAHPTTAGWTEQLQLTLGHQCWLISNAGLDGETVANMLTRQSAKILSSLGSFPFQIYVVWGGLNDFFIDGASAATIYSNLKTYCANIKSADSRAIVVLCTELPSTGAGWNAVRATINTSITTEASPTWDYIADLAANGTIGDDADASDTTYYSDGTHPTVAGDAIISSIIYNVIKDL